MNTIDRVNSLLIHSPIGFKLFFGFGKVLVTPETLHRCKLKKL